MTQSKINFDELRSQIDIVQVINAFIPLQKKGKNYFGICPFHDDSNPSLVVSPEKQIFKCFVCGTSGNVFTFIRDYQHISFLQAVKKACEIVGIKVPEFEEKSVIAQAQHQNLYDALKEVHNYYKYTLRISNGAPALEYLKKRKVDDALMDKFLLGYSPEDNKSAIKYLQNKGVSLDDVVYSGIGVEVNGDVVDRMAARITFGILDEYGRIVGYSGRRLKENQEQKYMNTPETILFHKGALLYNYYNCEKVCRRLGIVYLVEGFMDVIAFYRAGIENVVATMGTALTSEHIKLLKKLNCEVRILFDSDEAGQNAAFKSIALFKDFVKPLKVVKKFDLVNAKDADEVIDNYGPAKLLELINLTLDALDFSIQHLAANFNMENHDDRKAFVLKACHLLEEINDDFDREYYIDSIAKISGFNVALVKKYIPLRHSKPVPETTISSAQYKSNQQQKNLNRYQMAERQIIHELVNNPMAASIFERHDVRMYYEVNRRLGLYILDYYHQHGQVSMADVISILPADLVKEIIEIEDDIYVPTKLEELFDILKNDLLKEMELSANMSELDNIDNPHKQAEFAKNTLLKEGLIYTKTKSKNRGQ